MRGEALFTGTVCPFPYIWPSDLDHHTNLTAADCTETYGARLGAGYGVLQLFSFGIPTLVFLLLSQQMLALRRFTYKQNKMARMWDNASFPFYAAAMTFNLSLAVQSFDLFGFHGHYPAGFNNVLEQVVSATFMNVALVLVDFWLRCAKFGSRHGFPPRVLYAFLVIIGLNFVLSAIIGVVDYEHYVAYRIQRSFCGAAILSVFLYKGFAAVNELRRTLTSSSNHDNDNGQQQVPPSSPTTATASSATVAAFQKRAVQVLSRKLNQFAGVVGIAIIILMVSGIVALAGAVRTGQWHWKIDFFQQIEAMAIVFRTLLILGSLATLAFFKAPGGKWQSCLGGGGGGGGGADGNNNSKTTMASKGQVGSPTVGTAQLAPVFTSNTSKLGQTSSNNTGIVIVAPLPESSSAAS